MFLSKWLLALIGLVGITSNTVFGLRIGVMDEVVVLSSSPIQAITKPGFARAEGFQKELEGLYKQLHSLKVEFEKNEMIMDEKTRQKKQQDLLNLQKKFQAKTAQIEKEQEIIQNQVSQKLQDACTKIAKEKKFNILFSKMRGIVYADADFDITQDVIRALPKKELILSEKQEKTDVKLETV